MEEDKMQDIQIMAVAETVIGIRILVVEVKNLIIMLSLWTGLK